MNFLRFSTNDNTKCHERVFWQSWKEPGKFSRKVDTSTLRKQYFQLVFFCKINVTNLRKLYFRCRGICPKLRRAQKKRMNYTATLFLWHHYDGKNCNGNKFGVVFVDSSFVLYYLRFQELRRVEWDTFLDFCTKTTATCKDSPKAKIHLFLWILNIV